MDERNLSKSRDVAANQHLARLRRTLETLLEKLKNIEDVKMTTTVRKQIDLCFSDIDRHIETMSIKPYDQPQNILGSEEIESPREHPQTSQTLIEEGNSDWESSDDSEVQAVHYLYSDRGHLWSMLDRDENVKSRLTNIKKKGGKDGVLAEVLFRSHSTRVKCFFKGSEDKVVVVALTITGRQGGGIQELVTVLELGKNKNADHLHRLTKAAEDKWVEKILPEEEEETRGWFVNGNLELKTKTGDESVLVKKDYNANDDTFILKHSYGPDRQKVRVWVIFEEGKVVVRSPDLMDYVGLDCKRDGLFHDFSMGLGRFSLTTFPPPCGKVIAEQITRSTRMSGGYFPRKQHRQSLGMKGGSSTTTTTTTTTTIKNNNNNNSKKNKSKSKKYEKPKKK